MSKIGEIHDAIRHLEVEQALLHKEIKWSDPSPGEYARHRDLGLKIEGLRFYVEALIRDLCTEAKVQTGIDQAARGEFAEPPDLEADAKLFKEE